MEDTVEIHHRVLRAAMRDARGKCIVNVLARVVSRLMSDRKK